MTSDSNNAAEIELEKPFEIFKSWLKDAQATDMKEPTAMSLATVDQKGRPSVRIVLLKQVTSAGFVFYTNLESDKGQDLLTNPHAALCFHWMPLEKQVRIQGLVERVSDEDADEYFASRNRGSRIGAWASLQSRPLQYRGELEKRVAQFTAKFTLGKIPRPEYWSGFRVIPERIEFWAAKPFRLHDRQVYVRKGAGWDLLRLFP